jgi:hypothetical protein
VPLARLAAEPFVLFSRDVSPRYDDLVLTVCEQAGFTPSVRHEVRRWLTVVAFAACVRAHLRRPPGRWVRRSPSGAHACDQLDMARVFRAAREGARDLEGFVAALRDRRDPGEGGG